MMLNARLRHLVSACLLPVALSAAPATAATEFAPCTYRMFTPEAMLAYFTDKLPEWGLTFSSLGISRGEDLVAQLAYVENPDTGNAALEISDINGRKLLTVTEKVLSCQRVSISYYPEGICKQTTIWTSRDALAGGMPYTTVSPNTFEDDHFYFGDQVAWYTFRTRFDDTLSWLNGYLNRTPRVQRLNFASSLDRLNFAVATDPSIRSYLNLFSLRIDSRGVLVLDGIVPSHGVYYAILRHAWDLGYTGVDLRGVIDTSFQLVEGGSRIYRCPF